MTFLTLEMDPNVNKPLHIHSTEGWMFCEIAGGGGKSLVVQFFYFGNVNEIKSKILKKYYCGGIKLVEKSAIVLLVYELNKIKPKY